MTDPAFLHYGTVIRFFGVLEKDFYGICRFSNYFCLVLSDFPCDESSGYENSLRNES